jgi:hypothetical protein
MALSEKSLLETVTYNIFSQLYMTQIQTTLFFLIVENNETSSPSFYSHSLAKGFVNLKHLAKKQYCNIVLRKKKILIGLILICQEEYYPS